MDRPSEKLLKDMSREELSAEAQWHGRKAELLFDEVKEMRDSALEAEAGAVSEMLRAAMEKEAEADAHVRQSNLLDSLGASRLSDRGVGDIVHAGKA